MIEYLQVFPVEITRLPLLEKLYLDNNKLSHLPSELGELKSLKVLRVDYNMLVSVPGKHEVTFSLKWYLLLTSQTNSLKARAWS